MGDRITTYNDCPKCGGTGTFECYEAISSLMKVDHCESCGHTVNYDVNDDEDVVTVTKIAPTQETE